MTKRRTPPTPSSAAKPTPPVETDRAHVPADRAQIPTDRAHVPAMAIERRLRSGTVPRQIAPGAVEPVAPVNTLETKLPTLTSDPNDNSLRTRTTDPPARLTAQPDELQAAVQATRSGTTGEPVRSLSLAQRQRLNAIPGAVLESLSVIPDMLEIRG